MSAGALERGTAAAGALAGLAGVALSAVAAHLSGPGSLDVAARFLLVHAPALLAIAAALAAGLLHRGTGVAAAGLMFAGLVLFCGDLAWRVLAGPSPIPAVAPTGGVLLMVGWGLTALAGALGRR